MSFFAGKVARVLNPLFFRGPSGPSGPVIRYRNDFCGGVKPGEVGKIVGFLRLFIYIV